MQPTCTHTNITMINIDFLRFIASVEDFCVSDWLTDKDVQCIIREMVLLKGLKASCDK